MDDGRLLRHATATARPSSPASRSTSAARPGREAATGRGVHLRARRVVPSTTGARLTRPARRHPGLRQRRLVDGPRAARRAAPRSIAVSDVHGGLVDRRASTSPGSSPTSARRRGHDTAAAGDAVIQRGAARARRATCSCPAALGEVITDDNADASEPRSCSRPPTTRSRPSGDKILARPRHHGGPRHPRQRRRRDGLVLRVDPEHPAVHVEGGALQRRAPRQDAGRLPLHPGLRRRQGRARCARPPSPSASSASPTPPSSAATSSRRARHAEARRNGSSVCSPVSSSSVRCQPHRSASIGWPSSGPEAMSSSPTSRRTCPRGR